MSLRKEIRDFSCDKTPIRRSNISMADAWLRSHPVISTCYGFFMIAVAFLSGMGFLRWEQAFLRWSFVVLALCAAALFFNCGWKGKSEADEAKKR